MKRPLKQDRTQGNRSISDTKLRSSEDTKVTAGESAIKRERK